MASVATQGFRESMHVVGPQNCVFLGTLPCILRASFPIPSASHLVELCHNPGG